MRNKTKILFLCTGNSCRSQMAEGWARALKDDVIDSYSAGIEPHGMNARAIKVMAEAGIDISRQPPSTLDELKDVHFDFVVTVRDNAPRNLPDLSRQDKGGAHRLRRSTEAGDKSEH